MQQLLVDAIDLLDPDYVRVPMNRRIRLSPVAYAPLPNVEQYTAALTLLSGPMDTARFGHKGPNNEEHFQALQNLLHPERVVEAANQVGVGQVLCVFLRVCVCGGLLAQGQEACGRGRCMDDTVHCGCSVADGAAVGVRGPWRVVEDLTRCVVFASGIMGRCSGRLCQGRHEVQ
jgi:hypothetical protein